MLNGLLSIRWAVLNSFSDFLIEFNLIPFLKSQRDKSEKISGSLEPWIRLLQSLHVLPENFPARYRSIDGG